MSNPRTTFTVRCAAGIPDQGHPDPCPGAFGPVGCWSDLSRWKWVVGPQMTLLVRIPAFVAPTGVH